jgi:hypothetical protein
MRTSLEFPPALLLALKALAAQQNCSLRQVVLDTLERGLQAPLAYPAKTVGLPSVRLGAPMALSAQQLKSGDLHAYVPVL